MMKMYLRTTFELSEMYYLGKNCYQFQGVVQGNRVAPLSWLIINIFLIRYLYQKKIITKLVMLMSRLVVPLAALLYIDDTNLYVFNSGCNSAKEVV